MICVYVKNSSKTSDIIENKLKNLCIRFARIPEEQGETGIIRPSITEGGKSYSTRESIFEYLDLLEIEMTQMREISGDACYINPKTGKVC
ncbi:hypothetical protein [Flexithrix dorotheae]|uniref:hypothetical protein n=1 Tax=Flexithrix dorotheae TaxID=70993 RepID=UPI00036C9911|nr:hypothetical protein [Flexithrix dorotheae]